MCVTRVNTNCPKRMRNTANTFRILAESALESTSTGVTSCSLVDPWLPSCSFPKQTLNCGRGQSGLRRQLPLFAKHRFSTTRAGSDMAQVDRDAVCVPKAQVSRRWRRGEFWMVGQVCFQLCTTILGTAGNTATAVLGRVPPIGTNRTL